MNEEYIKAFVENFKRKIADLISINTELETLVAFKDAEIKHLREELEKVAPKEEAASA